MSEFRYFPNVWHKIKISNQELNKVINEYSIFFISNEINSNQDKNIFKQLRISKIAMIDQHYITNNNLNEQYSIVVFEKTIIITKFQSTFYLQPLFSSSPDTKFCFLSDIKKHFDENIAIKYSETSFYPHLKNDITKILQNIVIQTPNNPIYADLVTKIISCVFGYLMEKSYLKLFTNRIKNFDIQNQHNQIINKNEYIEVRFLGNGSSFASVLVYHIKNEEFYVIKIPINDEEMSKLNKREIENYSDLVFPFIPKFIGKTQNQNNLVIEFINGKTLFDIDKDHLSNQEKLTIIYELMETLNFLHQKHFIYRDLKPDNIMIDHDKNVVLIDFDRMVKYDDVQNNQIHTADFVSSYFAPEIITGNFSYSCDVYSLGKVINYIISDFAKYPEISEMINKCTQIDPNKRPQLCDLIDEFYRLYHSEIQNEDLFEFFEKGYDDLDMIEEYYETGKDLLHGKYVQKDVHTGIEMLLYAAEHNHSDAMVELGISYCQGKNVPQDIHKGIDYLKKASNLMNPLAQYNLGQLYANKKYVPLNINKALYYYSLAAAQNYPNAQFNIGFIYIQGKLVQRDVEKAIKYLKLAADQNVKEAQYILGIIYYGNIYVPRNIEKAINYFTLSAHQNYHKAQFCLGSLYYEGQYVTRNIEKAIDYFSKAADQGNRYAIYNLGIILYEGVHVEQNIYESVQYFSLAAKQNLPIAFHSIGILYIEGKYVERDVDKAIQYLSNAANQNFAESLYSLGCIYLFTKFGRHDIKKALYYFQLAANLNHSASLHNLGVIYREGEFVKRDIYKAIYYYNLAANQSNIDSIADLGVIYYNGIDIKYDIQKAIGYFNLAAEKNHPIALFYLGRFYYDVGNDKALEYLQRSSNQNFVYAQCMLGDIYSNSYNKHFDIAKSVHYYSLAANQNYGKAQYLLGLIYIKVHLFEEKRKKGAYWLKMATENRYFESYFCLGFLYHEGKIIDKNISLAVHYYKEGSSVNDIHAKNNLGIIYKNGYKNEIQKNIGLALEYFKEVIKRSNDPAPMYNLANIYIFNKFPKDFTNEAFDLLIKSSKRNFLPSKLLLSLILIKKYGFYIENIKEKLLNQMKQSVEFAQEICSIISSYNLNDTFVFEKEWKHHQETEYIYNIRYKIISAKDIMIESQDKSMIIDISDLFYEGFGKDLLD